MKKNIPIIILCVIGLFWYGYDLISGWFITPSVADTLSEQTNVWKWPMWTTYIILAAAGTTWFIIYQNASKRKRDNKFVEILKDTDGKIHNQSVISDEAGADLYVEKGQKKFMTMDTEKLKDLDPDDFK